MNLATNFRWDQSRFDAALRQKLDALETDKVPAAINKTSFFVALKGYGFTPKKDPFEISRSVGKIVTVSNKAGQSASIPILWVLAAKSVSKTWPEKKMLRGEWAKRAVSAGKAYLKALEKKSSTILGSRKRASGFFRVGFLSIIKKLGPFVRNKGGKSYPSEGVKIKGQLKGNATPATSGLRPTCTLTHSASAKSDRKNGQLKIVGPALQRAMDSEAQGIIDHLKEETQTVLNGRIE